VGAVTTDPQRARGALRKIRPVLENPQRAHEALSALRQKSESAARSAAAGHARLPVLADGRLGRTESAAARRAIARAGGTASLVNGMGLLVRLSRLPHTLAIPHTGLALLVGLLRCCKVPPKEQGHSLGEAERPHKCAFVAGAFGLDMGYEWHLHECGAFSSFLAAGHVELVDGKMRVGFGEAVGLQAVPGYPEFVKGAQDGAPRPAVGFEAGRFVSLVRGKDRAWLSVASAIIRERGPRPGETLPAHAARISADCGERPARRVMADIAASRPPAWEAPAAGARRDAWGAHRRAWGARAVRVHNSHRRLGLRDHCPDKVGCPLQKDTRV